MTVSPSDCLNTGDIVTRGITSSVTFEPNLQRAWRKFDMFILPILVVSGILATLVGLPFTVPTKQVSSSVRIKLILAMHELLVCRTT